MNAVAYVDTDQGIHYGKIKVTQNAKRKNYLGGFSNFINMVNFEAFFWVISSSINLLFLKSDYIIYQVKTIWWKEYKNFFYIEERMWWCSCCLP